MYSSKPRWGVVTAAIGFALTGLVAGCGPSVPSGPAPVVMKGPNDSGWQGPPPQSYSSQGYSPKSYSPPPLAYSAPHALGPQPMHAAAPPIGESHRTIVVERGESLGRLAARYHVSEHAIIDANHLRPPYKIEIGARLVIPGAGEAPPMQTAAGPASIPLQGPPPSQAGAPPPAVVPLDGPPREAGTLTPPAAAAPAPPTGERSVAEEARQDVARPPPAAAAPQPAAETHGGRFPWPVRGNVVSGYGVESNGGKNDGINIAAPMGSPVRAIEGGEVAYAGNELKGYGNLVLIKHADGLISAYAHCEELLVKKGERVSAGQVIAKVGTSGGVKDPQLHFELRKGQKPVDPREFLAPAPRAANERAAG